MRKLLPALAAITLLAASSVDAGESFKRPLFNFCNPFQHVKCLEVNSFHTEEVCRRYYSQAVCVHGVVQHVQLVEVTYKTTDKCGKEVVWKKTFRA